MIKPYLIQRVKINDDCSISFYYHISENIWAYMLKSLKRIRDNKNAYVQFEYSIENFENKPITILCKEGDKAYLPKIINQIYRNEIHLQERCDLSVYLNNDNSYSTREFWWDIENDYFFWMSNEKVNKEFVNVLFQKTT